jgi:tetratricopeptide (TPR) repeat protein
MMIQRRIDPAVLNLVTLGFPAVFIFTLCFSCLAQNVHYKDGTTAEVEIVSRTSGTVWVRGGPGLVGIDVEKIDKITNNDGTISKFDVNSLVARIQEAIREQNYLQAQGICTSLLEFDPGNAHIRYLRGMLNQKIGNFSKAIEDYNFLISHKNADEAVLNNLGAIDAQLKKYGQAEELFARAVNYNPLRAESHNNLAELFASLKDYDRAVEEYNTVLKLEPENLTALFNLGVIYKNKGDYPEAGKYWRKILAVKPGDAAAKKALVSLKCKRQ